MWLWKPSEDAKMSENAEGTAIPENVRIALGNLFWSTQWESIPKQDKSYPSLGVVLTLFKEWTDIQWSGFYNMDCKTMRSWVDQILDCIYAFKQNSSYKPLDNELNPDQKAIYEYIAQRLRNTDAQTNESSRKLNSVRTGILWPKGPLNSMEPWATITIWVESYGSKLKK